VRNRESTINTRIINEVKKAIAAQFLVFRSVIKIGVKYLVTRNRYEKDTIPHISIIAAECIECIVLITVAIIIEHITKPSEILKRGDLPSNEYTINVPSLKSTISYFICHKL
jgi:hypothetical protein